MIGHASIQLMYETYGHLMPDAVDALSEKLDALAAGPAAHSGVTWGHNGLRGRGGPIGGTRKPGLSGDFVALLGKYSHLQPSG